MIKFYLVENQKWPLLLKIAKPLKSTFLQNHLIYLAEILCRDLFDFQKYLNEKTSMAELGYNDLNVLPIYVPYFA